MAAMYLEMSVQKLLVDQGLVPSNCRRLEILMPASGAIVLRYEVFLSPEQLPKFAAVFAAMDASQVAHREQ